MRRAITVCFIAMLALLAMDALADEIVVGGTLQRSEYVKSISKPITACPAGATCTDFTRVPGEQDVWTRAIMDGPDGFPTRKRQCIEHWQFVNGVPTLITCDDMLTDDSDPWRRERADRDGDDVAVEVPHLRGVRVKTLWQMANAVNASWLVEPQFTSAERVFVGTSTLDAVKPETGEPLPVEISWLVAEAADVSLLLTDFDLPLDTSMVVIGRYTYTPTGKSVETYTAIKQRPDGSLVSEDLGARLPDGSVASATGNLAAQAFQALGIRGPYTKVIHLPASE